MAVKLLTSRGNRIKRKMFSARGGKQTTMTSEDRLCLAALSKGIRYSDRDKHVFKVVERAAIMRLLPVDCGRGYAATMTL